MEQRNEIEFKNWEADLNLFDKSDSPESDNLGKSVNSEIADIPQQLMKYINKTNQNFAITSQNFAILNDKINEIQVKVDQFPTETSGINIVDGNSFSQIETKIAEISEEITKLNEAVYVNIKECFMELVNLIAEHK